jgi:hypothetical protein
VNIERDKIEEREKYYIQDVLDSWLQQPKSVFFQVFEYFKNK